jgi:hypothetical protein
MEKIIVPTKFNKSGKRVLSIPLDENKVYALAYQQYHKAYHAAEVKWKCENEVAIRAYVERIATWIASYIAKDSTPSTEKHRIAKFLAEQALAKQGPISITGPRSSQRWSAQLGDIPELASIEEDAWEAYISATNKADQQRQRAIAKASTDSDEMKRALWREVSDYMHRQYHQEDTH